MPTHGTEYTAIDPERSFSSYYEELEASAAFSPAYKEFLEAVKNTDKKIRALHARDSYGRVKMLTEEDKKELLRLHAEIGTKAELILADEKDPSLRRTVRKVASLAPGNYNQISSYSPEDPKTLPELLEDVRAIKLNLGNTKLKGNFGGRQSIRQPITFVNEGGQTITGLFTPAQYFNVTEKFRSDLKKLAEKLDLPEEEAAIVTGLPDRFRARKIERYKAEGRELPEADAERDLNELFNLLRHGGSYTRENLDKVLDEIYANDFSGRNSASKKLRFEAKQGIVNLLQKYDIALGVPAGSAMIPGGSRLDNRSAAMSTVADLLGVPDLIARSRPMKIVTKDGKEIEGTFMTEANGLDINNLQIDAINTGSNSLKNTDGNAMKNVADLQVLDYICGNVDRHGGNVFYQFNGLGKLIGIQGIDNESCFGTFLPKNFANKNRMVGPDNMNVISYSMYKKLFSIKSDQLRFVLRGYGLSEKELDAAGKRFNILKNKLVDDVKYYKGKKFDPNKPFDKGHIRVVPDETFKKLSFNKLSNYHTSRDLKIPVNLFGLVRETVKILPETYEKQKKEYESLKSDVVIGVNNRAIPANLEKSEGTSSQLLREMQNRTVTGWWKWHHGTSKEFEQMRRAVRDYNEFQKELKDRIRIANDPEAKKDPNLILKSVINTKDIIKLSVLGKRMKSTAETYLRGKEGRNNNPYTQSRMEVANLVRTLGEKAMVRKPEEMELARKNEARADERFRHATAEMDIRFQNTPAIKDNPKNKASYNLGYNKPNDPMIQNY